MDILFKNKKIELKHTMRSMMMYENITGTSKMPNNMTDILTLYYCIVIASCKDYSITFDDFIDECDEHPEIIDTITKWMTNSNTVTESIKKN